jgi:aspartyl-tRNA(Asn)/glutamyl-tRNA(Gln) amidotransferase subunit B
MRSAEEAYEYLTALKLTLSYLGVSDCDMEKGSLRCDANVSIRPMGETKLGTKAELKNLNSFSAVKKAIEFEVGRQTGIILSGGKVVQETLLWDEAKGRTLSMRSKEQAHDYRYFPEPDLVPFTLSTERINAVQRTIPELPYAKISRFMDLYKLNQYDAFILAQDQDLAAFFEACVKLYPDAKKVANWLNGPLMKELNERKKTFSQVVLLPLGMTTLIRKVEDGVVSNLVGKDILTILLDEPKTVDVIIQERGLAQVSDDAVLEKIVDEVLADNPKAVLEIKGGKTGAMGFLVGQAMKKMQGKANPKKMNEILTRRLQNV